MATPPSLSIAVLLFPDHQNLDAVGTMDYLNSHSQAYLANFPTVQHLGPKAPILTWYFVSDALDPVTATSGPKQLPAHTMHWLSRMPAPLRALMHESWFLVESTLYTRTVFTPSCCRYGRALAQIGVLDGYHVACNKMALTMVVDAGKLNGAVHWMGDARWMEDKRVWSAAKVTNVVAIVLGDTEATSLGSSVAKTDDALVGFAKNPNVDIAATNGVNKSLAPVDVGGDEGKTCVANTAAGAASVKEVSPALEYPTCPSHRRTSKSFGVIGL
ncbi:uncharacterized protein LACBIDRAFT_329649 [Laccaria bicolor S238N-H82]|uniref:Predicted protein n=1 Tax=Laccaria bicolor (strain S238N-H82 / ATCC MYA-4686) TaxID=486041 RepID=B0DIP9_LACBS|nr:uncharacterized protein LACBIDRAFT_329649 [Laccaria bicolor S238N-H82]EDR05608.1 predicted protein [Laccaria bicolor S238N-H82]|eukprot:XP_001883712.1 predicted protein [Laccaria bicolor S238N-H82]